MRKLIYAPILHSGADLGSVAKEVEKKGINMIGEEKWHKHKETIAGFWNSIENYFKNMQADFSKVKIYQDGLVADGELGMKVVETAALKGSKNYQIISELVKRGATIVKTEDLSAVKEEVEQIKNIARSKSLLHKLWATLKYKFYKSALLKDRDEFIAKQIIETLNDGETGVLFIGAFHDIISKLPRDVKVEEIKEKNKVEKYQNIFFKKNKELEIMGLEEYLKAPIVVSNFDTKVTI